MIDCPRCKGTGKITPRKPEDYVGRRFGRLVVIEFAGRVQPHGEARWSCRCDCGAGHVAKQLHLISGETKSCGCYRKEVSRIRGQQRLGKRRAKPHHFIEAITLDDDFDDGGM